MDSLNRRRFLQAGLLASGGVWLDAHRLWAQLPPGVETRAVPVVTGEERQSQPNLWCMEVNFKPVRMLFVDLPSGKNQQLKPTLVWYLCYRAINRPIERRDSGEGSQVVLKELDDSSLVFIPEFTLVTDDNHGQKRYLDRVMPGAQKAINKRERGNYKNSVEIVSPVPPPTPYGEPATGELYGVATWRGVDPETDRFKIFMTGFSNGYQQVTDPDGATLVQRKTLVQEFWRPGDELEENEMEIRRTGMPQWVYR